MIWGALWLLNFIIRAGGAAGPIVETLALEPDLLKGEWQHLLGLVGYAFVHDPGGILHVFFNGYLLWIFGPEVETLFPKKRFIQFLLVVILVGAAAHLGLSLIASVQGAIGGSGIVMAVIAVNAAMYPQRILNLILFRCPMIWFFVGLLFLDFLRSISFAKGESDGVAFDVHLAGALVGWMWVDGFERFGIKMPWRNWQQKARERTQEKKVKSQIDEEKELDRILAKISQEGMPSLSKSERKFLEKRSTKKSSS